MTNGPSPNSPTLPGLPHDELLRIVRVASAPTGSLGGAWMTTQEEEAATTAAGLVGWQLYFIGRHGVLGDVDADVITAAAYVFPADHVRANWEAAIRVLSPAAAAERYIEICHGWGRAHLSGFSGTRRLTELTESVVSHADVTALPLFAGWRAWPQPDDEPARLAQLLHVMREHRGACHGVALAAMGMQPLMAILADQGGQENAKEYGWNPPFPTANEHDRALRNQVEDLTDSIAAPAYGSLSAKEAKELVDLLGAAHAHAFS